MLPWTPPSNLGGGGQQQQGQQQHGGQQQRPPLNAGSQGWGNPPQGQGQPQPQQQQQGQQQQGQMHILQPEGPPQPSPITLSSVLHYLQTEWRRYERERNEWEIERGEMRARIALLEGERRGNENLKTDLMRRVKMLEYALRQERNRYLTNAQQNAAAAAAAVTAQREKEAAAAANATANKEKKPAEGAENEDKKNKVASAIPENKKKALATAAAVVATGAGTASGRASPAPPSEDGQSSAGSSGVPEVIVSASAQPSSTASAVPAHLQQGQANLHRAGSTASLVSLPNGASTMNIPAGSSTLNLGGGTLNLSGFNPGVGRDPRARAKSREYLKQCLQEITYLTSAAALNPLPERTPGGVSRPRKEMRDIPREKEKEEVPPIVPPPVVVVQQDKEGNKIVPLDPAAAVTAEKPTNAEALNTILPISEASQIKSEAAAKGDVGGNPSLNGPLARKAEATTALTSDSSSSSAPKAVADLFSNLQSADTAASAAPAGDSANQVTAIFRPESSEEWQKALKKAGQSIQGPQAGSSTDAAGSTVSLKELQEKNGKGSSAIDASVTAGKNGGANAAPANTMRGRSDTAVLASSSGPSSSSSSQKEAQDSNEHKNWKARRTLRAHLDATRCLAFDRSERPSDVTLVTGGDDCTVKVWRLPPQSVAAQSRGQHMPDSEPTQTYRGHSSAITSLCTSATTQRIYSSSLDSTVQVWALPPKDREPYAPFDPSLNLLRLEGHTDGVWDTCLLGGTSSDKEVLATASADGTVKVWDVSPSRTAEQGGDLKLSWIAQGTENAGDQQQQSKPIPTSLALCQSDMTKLAVAYQDALVRIFDTETGRLVLTLQSNEGYDGTPATQINRIVSHPTLPMLMTAHENKYIRLYDLKNGACTHSILAHSDAVTSLDVDPSGLTIASSSHDCSVRFWDLLQTRSCIQEMSAMHRNKGDEGVLDLKYHPTLPFVASAGADGTVGLYG